MKREQIKRKARKRKNLNTYNRKKSLSRLTGNILKVVNAGQVGERETFYSKISCFPDVFRACPHSPAPFALPSLIECYLIRLFHCMNFRLTIERAHRPMVRSDLKCGFTIKTLKVITFPEKRSAVFAYQKEPPLALRSSSFYIILIIFLFK